MCTCSGNHPWGTERARGGHPRPRLSPAQAPRPPKAPGWPRCCGQCYLELEFQLSLEVVLLTLDGHSAAQLHGHGAVENAWNTAALRGQGHPLASRVPRPLLSPDPATLSRGGPYQGPEGETGAGRGQALWGQCCQEGENLVR